MKTRLLVLCALVAAVSAQSISPASLTTGLSWFGAGSNNYAPVTFSTTGLSCAPCTWSLHTAYATEDGVTQTDLGTISGCTANNVNCNYTAPLLYDTGAPTLTLQATDGTHTVTAAVTMQYPANLREAMLHRGRLELANSLPMSALDTNPCQTLPAAATQITCWATWPLWFDPIPVTYAAGTGINFFQPLDRRGWISWLPPLFGFSQGELTWTKDGNWLFLGAKGGAQVLDDIKTGPCPAFAQKADGTGLQCAPGMRDWSNFGSAAGLGFELPLERGDGEWIAQGFNTSSTNALGIMDMASISPTNNYYAETNIYSIATTQSGLVADVQNNSNTSGYYGTHLIATQPNPSNCTQVTGCTDIPQLFNLDLSACYATLAANCATLAYPAFSINLGITGLGWGANDANPHCDVSGDPPGGTQCEYHVHASGTRKNTPFAGMNYGPAGSGGEEIGYLVDTTDPAHKPILAWPDARFPTTGLTPPFTNTPYFGHGDWSFNGNLFIGSGFYACNPNASHACTNPGNDNEHVYDFRTTSLGIVSWAGTPVQYSQNTSSGQGHDTWDTFDLADSFADGWSGTSGGSTAGNTWQVYDDYIPPSQGQAQTWLDAGQRSGADAGGVLWPPAASPDGTLASEMLPESFDCFSNNGGCENHQTLQNISWLNVGALLRYPAPPLGLRMTNSGGSAAPAFSFVPNFLNHEAASYNVYRCTAATSGCSLLTTIPAVYQNIYNDTAYTLSDASFTAGGPFWYGVAAVNREGIEGELLSNTVQVSLSGGTYTGSAANGAGTGHFDSSTPAAAAWVSASEEHMPNAGEAGQYPNSITQGAGGSLPDDWYWVFVTLVQCKDYPACSQFTTELAPAISTVNSIQVASGGGTASVTFATNDFDMWGQHGYQIWMAQTATNTMPALSRFTLQTCGQAAGSFYQLPARGNTPSNGTAASVLCTVKAFATATAFGSPASNNTVQDFKLTWTANPASDRVAYWDLYYAEGAAPTLGKGEDPAQPQLIASVPATYCTAGASCTWRDPAPNIGAVEAGTHIFYGLVPVSQNGARGPASCWDATAGAAATCN